jgi:hypothetical protein
VGTILDTARARRAPSRWRGVRAAFVRQSPLGKRLRRGFMSPTLLYVSYALRWKTQYLGNYVLNGVLPPENALI